MDPPHFLLFTYIFIVNNIILSFFLLLCAFVSIAIQSAYMSVRSVCIFRKQGGLMLKLGVVPALGPAKNSIQINNLIMKIRIITFFAPSNTMPGLDEIYHKDIA